jgi:hypothetical protein
VSTVVIGIVLLALLNFALKAVGPVLLVDREPSPTVTELIMAMSPALLAGLVTVEIVGARWAGFDWTVLPGLAAAALADRRGAPNLACVGVAVLVTAGIRLAA